MLFQKKTKGFFVERTEHSWLLSRVSSLMAPMTVERLVEVPVNDAAGLKSALLDIQEGKASGTYLSAVASVYPERRLVRKGVVDLKRTKEPAYLNEFCQQQFRVDPDKYTLAVLSSNDGHQLDPHRLIEKDLLFCGLPSDDLNVMQDSLLESGVYPLRLELGSVSVVGALIDYLRFARIKTPVLLLEIGDQATMSYIVSANSLENSRSIPFGLEAMVPVVQKKLGLKDEESAKKLFYSNTFDFASMGAELVQKLLKELQSSIGFYEVQTGQSISHLVCSTLPDKLSWVQNSITNSLGISILNAEVMPWLQSHQISFSGQLQAGATDARWFGLYSLMLNYQSSATASNAAVTEAKK